MKNMPSGHPLHKKRFIFADINFADCVLLRNPPICKSKSTRIFMSEVAT